MKQGATLAPTGAGSAQQPRREMVPHSPHGRGVRTRQAVPLFEVQLEVHFFHKTFPNYFIPILFFFNLG